MVIKIVANGLDHAVAGGELLVQGPRDDIEQLKDTVMEDLQTILSRVDRGGKVIFVGPINWTTLAQPVARWVCSCCVTGSNLAWCVVLSRSYRVGR